MATEASLDEQGRIIKMNRAEFSWLGYRAEELIGERQYRDYVTPGHEMPLMRLLMTC